MKNRIDKTKANKTGGTKRGITTLPPAPKKPKQTWNPNLEKYAGMPGAALAEEMIKSASPHVEAHPRAFRADIGASVERDCDVISRLHLGRFAWILDQNETLLIEIGWTMWANDAFDRSLIVSTVPPVCMGANAEIGWRFLQLPPTPLAEKGLAYYLINVPIPGPGTIRASSRHELLGIATEEQALRRPGLIYTDPYWRLRAEIYSTIRHPRAPEMARLAPR